MKLTLTVLICTFISTFKVSVAESDATPDTVVNPVVSKDVWPKRISDMLGDRRDESFAAAIGNLDPENMAPHPHGSKISTTGFSTGETCDPEEIQRGWTVRVSEFQRQLENLQSLTRISFEDLIVHLENGTVEDSWVEQLVEHGKHLRVTHKDHNEGKEQPEQVDSTSKGESVSSADSSTGSPTGEACDLKEIQRGWTLRVSKFQHQMKNLLSVIKIAVKDLLVHLENGTVEDSWVEQLVEHGKHLKDTHKDHSEDKEQPEQVESTSKGESVSSADSSTGSPMPEACDLKEIQRGWTLQVSKFQHQMKNLKSVIKIAFEDLIVHLEDGTMEDSWVEQLVEHGKHLKVTHKDHSEERDDH